MNPHDPQASFNADVAARYDDDPRGDEDAAVAFLAELAGDGPALEFAIGTGRIALPLAATDITVDGIELSGAMVERLRQKPGGRAWLCTSAIWPLLQRAAPIRSSTLCSTPSSISRHRMVR